MSAFGGSADTTRRLVPVIYDAIDPERPFPTSLFANRQISFAGRPAIDSRHRPTAGACERANNQIRATLHLGGT
jgi:hypothetical protein